MCQQNIYMDAFHITIRTKFMWYSSTFILLCWKWTSSTIKRRAMRKKKITQDICTSFIYFIFIQNKRKILWKDWHRCWYKIYTYYLYGWYVMFYINIYEDENHVIYALAIFRDVCAKSLEPTIQFLIGFYSNIA